MPFNPSFKRKHSEVFLTIATVYFCASQMEHRGNLKGFNGGNCSLTTEGSGWK
jgi:hypothetical protein